jgi:hypothetical protein
MAAIITDKFRRNSVSTVLADLVGNDNNYYIGIGKTDAWPVIDGFSETETVYNVAAPTGTRNELNEVRNNLISLLKVDNSTARVVIPKVPFALNKVYKQYSSVDEYAFVPTGNILPCYTIYNNKIWLCLKSSGDAVTAAPSGEALYEEVEVATGSTSSTWIAIARTENGGPFNTDQFAAVVPIANEYELEPGLSANAATAGRVYGFNIVDGGAGYTGTTTAVLIGDGTVTPIDLDVTTTAGVLTGIDFTDANTTLNFANASVVITGTNTSPAIITPNIAPLEGFGPTILDNLPTWFIGLSADFDGVLQGDAQILKYRQISLIKNPELVPDDLTPQSADALKYITINATGMPTWSTGIIISEEGATPKAWLDSIVAPVSGNEYKVYYHQNDSPDVNYGVFSAAGEINISGTAYTILTAPTESEYVHNTGEVLFIENRKPISRDANQIEQIKLVIQY